MNGTPTPENSAITEYTYSAEPADDGLAYTYTPYGLAPAIPHEHYWGNREQVDGRDEGFSCESANE